MCNILTMLFKYVKYTISVYIEHKMLINCSLLDTIKSKVICKGQYLAMF